jgi:biotin operon repressor
MDTKVIAFDRGNVPAVREEYTEAIQIWCQTRDLADTLSREEIGAMKAFDRIDAQRKAIILNLAHYYRTHDRSDVAPGLAVIITLLSDNDEGSAKISQEMLAKFFGRSRTAIYQAQSRLKEAGIIVTGRGRHAKTYPVIPRVVTQGYNHIAWTVNAIAQDSTNCKDPASNCQLLSPPEQLSQLQRQPEQLEDFNCQVEPVSIAKAALTPIHYKSSIVVDRAAKVVAAGIATALGSLPAAAEPSDPPSISQPAKPSPHELADQLHEAAGKAINLTKPAMHVIEVPRNWMAAGCDLNLDILPTIRAMCIGKPPNMISSWKYFERAVMDAMAARTAPIAEGRAPPASSREPNWHEKQEAALKYLLR